jgi:glycosyltransferase involved in cell wall biosynthesis
MAASLVFDVRANHDTGVSRYGLSVLGPSARRLTAAGWRISVIARSEQLERAEAAVNGLGIRVMCVPAEDGFVRRSAWLRNMLVSEGVDLYFTAHYTVDRQCPVPFVFTIYDLTRLRLPEFSYTDAAFADRFGADELYLVRDELAALASWDDPGESEETFIRYFRALNRYLAQRAAKIVTVSRSSARDIHSLLGVDPGRLAVIPCGVDRSIFHRRDQSAVRLIRDRHGLPGPYLMFVGLAHPHKRFPWLLEQLVRQRHNFPAETRLVAVGGYAEKAIGVAELLTQYRAADFLVFTGRISDADLASLYSAASALVTASLNEGSNLPSLEAMACGCPVIATDIPPHREMLGNTASYYQPTAGGELVRLVGEALTGRLRNRTGTFRPPSWPNAGRHLSSVFSQVISN